MRPLAGVTRLLLPRSSRSGLWPAALIKPPPIGSASSAPPCGRTAPLVAGCCACALASNHRPIGTDRNVRTPLGCAVRGLCVLSRAYAAGRAAYESARALGCACARCCVLLPRSYVFASRSGSITEAPQRSVCASAGAQHCAMHAVRLADSRMVSILQSVSNTTQIQTHRSPPPWPKTGVSNACPHPQGMHDA